MASSASEPTAQTLFTSLPARPPTPPREANQENIDASLSKSQTRPPTLTQQISFDARLSLQTPPSGASSPTDRPNAVEGSNTDSVGRMRKKVEWSTHTEYKEPVQYSNGRGTTKPSPLSATPSATSKPIKGILKPSSSPNPLASSLSSNLDGPVRQVNIAEMLDSTIKQLAGSDRDSRLDAYMTLARALKASNNLPDRVALQDKMSLFTQFIQRDVTSKNESGSFDFPIVKQALNLLATFLHFQAIASAIPTDFGVFIVDHAIRSFEDPSLPKEVVRHIMQVVAFQNFSPKVMTSDRVGRLISSLHNIEDHVKGKSIVVSRIQIYKRLVKQVRMHMMAHTDWIKDMFTDMLSTVKEIRSHSINLGIDAGYALRADKQLLRRVTDILQTVNEDQTYIEFYIQRLQDMLKEKQFPSAVPQIWAVITLFLRCPLERWQYYGPWLTLAQSAFNTTDGLCKQEANYAWNRYVHLSLTDSKLSPKALGTLCTPLLSQLRRKSSVKHQEEGLRMRRVVTGGICNLYYYAFRPGNDKYPTDMAWDATVYPTISQLIDLDGKPDIPGDCIMLASKMLAGLLDVSTPRVWREDRIMDLPPVKADELPAIDSKWVRRNSDKIFRLVGPILEKRFLDLANKDSLTYRLWQAIVGSVAAASAKDIKVSEDTSRFFAATFGLLSKIWSQGASDDASANAKFLPSVRHFVSVLVSSLGMLPFTERKLSMTVSNTFEPIVTPSHRSDRSDKNHGVVQLPLHHLFSMLSSVPSGKKDNEELAEFLMSVFEPFLAGKTTKGRIELSRELLRLLPRTSLSPFGPWVLAAQNTSLILEKRQGSPEKQDHDKQLGPEYREVVSLLERGLVSCPNLPSNHWLALFNLLSRHVVQGFGDAGRALVVIEPLARILLENSFAGSAAPSSISLRALRTVFEDANLPRDRQAVEVARRRLWGTPAIPPKAGPCDPFDNLYTLGDAALSTMYWRLGDPTLLAVSSSIITAVDCFLSRCLSQGDVLGTLGKMMDGICLWIRDEENHLQSEQGAWVLPSVGHLWESISASLVRHGTLDKDQLRRIEPLLTAAFMSPCVLIVNRAAETWNAIFQDEESVECSESLKSVLSSVRSKVEVSLPGTGLPAGEFGAQATSMIDSAEAPSFVLSSASTSRHDYHQTPPSAVSASRRATGKRPLTATPDEVTEKPSKRTSTPRLRHDNSQIEFTTIRSSSPLHNESQHLTERQIEIRERQQETVNIYSDVQSSSPPRDEPALPVHGTNSGIVTSSRPLNATPQRSTSYENLISSTPTPRRGQVLQMDDNDPPSSPPEPRPYPLLSEIRSRSRTSSSLENWEFSSPPGSPVTSHQLVTTGQSELPHLAMTDDTTQNKASDLSKAAEDEGNNDIGLMEVIPSSVAAPGSPQALHVSQASRKPFKARDRQRPRTRKTRSTRSSQAMEPPVPSEGEVVDARSSPQTSIPKGADSHGLKTAGKLIDNSFAHSDGDESKMMRMVADIENKDMASQQDHVSVSPVNRIGDPIQDCITVLADSPPAPRRSKRGSNRSSSPVVPSTPAEPSDPARDESKKRKRGGVHSDQGQKKRRSLQRGGSSIISEKSSSPYFASDGVETRRRTRSGSTRHGTSTAHQPQAIEGQAFDDASSASQDSGDALDTDEELASQLVTESRAASKGHSQSPPRELEVVDESIVIEESKDMTSAGDATAQDMKMEEELVIVTPEDNPSAGSIMEALRGGLDGLRQASLLRSDVHQIEDLLMDMKRELYEAERRGRNT